MKFPSLLVALLAAVTLQAQPLNPIKWTFSTQPAGNGQIDLILTGTIEEGWSTYSQVLESEDGPIPTSLSFKEGAHYKLVGKAVESGEKVTVYDPIFAMNLTKFKHTAVFTQRIEVKDASKPVEGYISYMSCNDEMCLPPRDVDFSFKLSGLK